MNPPEKFERIFDQKRYSVQNSTLIASDKGQLTERSGQNTFLYKTQKGNYFMVCVAIRPEDIQLIPLTQDEACELYETFLSKHEVSYSAAFPSVVVQDA